MSRFVLAGALALFFVSAAEPVCAQVVDQLTDFRTGIVTPGALNDAGTTVFAGGTIDPLGTNPRHAPQIFEFDAVSAAPTQLTARDEGVTLLLSVGDDGGWLAFASNSDLTGSNHDRSSELFVMRPDGTGLAQLTDDPTPNAGSVGFVAISGDASRVLFTSNADLTGSNPDLLDQLYIVDRAGTNLQQVSAFTTAQGGGLGGVSFSDDAARIVFAHNGDLLGTNADLGSEIFAIEADGTNLRQLTTTPVDFGSSAPALSGNGQTIAFQSSGDLTGGNPSNFVEIFTIAWDGTGLSQLTSTSVALGITGDPASQSPSITDDGVWIFFNSNDSSIFPPVNIDGNFEIFKVRSDGSGFSAVSSSLLSLGSFFPTISGAGTRVTYLSVGSEIQLQVADENGNGEQTLTTYDVTLNSAPDLSPDGAQAVFVNSPSLLGGAQIWQVATDGSVPAAVTALSDGSPAGPSIAGDNQTIVFSSTSNPNPPDNDDGSEEIFRVNVDGSGLTQLTSAPAGDSNGAVISADGSLIVFDSSADLLGTNPDGSTEIFAMDPLGANLVQLTSSPADTVNQLARVDASGTRIAFESNADLDGGNPDGTFEIYTMLSNGTGLLRITGDAVESSRAPDIDASGNVISFSSSADLVAANPELNTEIFRYDIGAASLEQLTSFAEGSSGGVRITGNGDWIYFSSDAPVFESDPDMPSDVYRVPAAGGAIERVGALRIGGLSGIAIASLLGGGSAAVADDDTKALVSGLADLTGENPDILSEIWLIDRSRVPQIRVSKATPTLVDWDPVSGPLRYDVIRGDVASLSGSVDLGPVVCLENDSPDLSIAGQEDPLAPPAGTAFFFVFRGSPGLADPGSYGTGSGGGERLAGAGDCSL